MIPSLYPKFADWAAKGSVYLVSDTHFEDEDCLLMDPDWMAPEEHAKLLKKRIGKNDTLIHLGDVGNPAYLDRLRCHKVLVRGNHDVPKAAIDSHFDEVFDGPIFIGEKILLSHEPIMGLDWCVNIHGHDHAASFSDEYHLNLAVNVFGYEPANLGRLIKGGLLSGIDDIHKKTVRRAVERKEAREAEAETVLED